MLYNYYIPLIETSTSSLPSLSLLNALPHSVEMESTTPDLTWEIVLNSPLSKVIKSWFLNVLLQTPNH